MNKLYTKSKATFPLDLRPRRPERKVYSDMDLQRDKMLESVVENVAILASTNIIERGLVGRNISIGTSPVQIIDGRFLRGYVLFNQSNNSGSLTVSGTLVASAAQIAGATANTRSTPLGVGNYKNLSVFLNISATGGGVITVDAESQDPVSLNWATTQSDIFSSVSAVGTYHAFLGDMGIDTNFAITWSVSAAGSSTFSLSFVQKDGLPGSSVGVSNTIYLGGEDVNTNTGFPLEEGKSKSIWARPNAELFAISRISGGITLSVFDLQ